MLEACNGRDALTVAGNYSGKIDLLVTDVVMPEMGGVELAQWFAELCPGTAVIHMSGYTGRTLSPEIMESMLHKPFTPDTLLRRIRQALSPRGGERSESSGAFQG